MTGVLDTVGEVLTPGDNAVRQPLAERGQHPVSSAPSLDQGACMTLRPACVNAMAQPCTRGPVESRAARPTGGLTRGAFRPAPGGALAAHARGQRWRARGPWVAIVGMRAGGARGLGRVGVEARSERRRRTGVRHAIAKVRACGRARQAVRFRPHLEDGGMTRAATRGRIPRRGTNRGPPVTPERRASRGRRLSGHHQARVRRPAAVIPISREHPRTRGCRSRQTG